MADCKHTNGILNLLYQAKPHPQDKGKSIVPNWVLALVADSIRQEAATVIPHEAKEGAQCPSAVTVKGQEEDQHSYEWVPADDSSRKRSCFLQVLDNSAVELLRKSADGRWSGPVYEEIKAQIAAEGQEEERE